MSENSVVGPVKPWLPIVGLLVGLAAIGAWITGTRARPWDALSRIGPWVTLALVAVGVAFVVARFGPRLGAGTLRIVSLALLLAVPILFGFIAFRSDTVAVTEVLRYLGAASVGIGVGLIVASGAYVDADGIQRTLLMQVLRGYREAADTLAGWLGWISALLIFPTVAVSFVNVVLRRIGAAQGQNLTSNALIEAQWYLFGLLFVTGLAYILREGINVRVDFWFGNRSSRTQSIIDVVGHMIGLLPFAYLGIRYSWPSVDLSWAQNEQSPNAQGLFRPPIKTVLMMAFVFLAIQGVAELIKNIEYLVGTDYRAEDDNPALAGGQVLSVEDFDVENVPFVGKATQ